MIKFFKRLWRFATYVPGEPPRKIKRLSSVYYETEDYKELKTLDASDLARVDILTETSYALHDAHQAGDLILSLRICKEAIEKLDAISGQPGTDRIVQSIQELENYNKSLVSQSMSGRSSE